MSELKKPNEDYTEDGLRYPGMKADIDLCYKYLHELCQIVQGNGRDGYKPKMTMWSIPPQPNNFDMQISAALDELKFLREEQSKIAYIISHADHTDDVSQFATSDKNLLREKIAKYKEEQKEKWIYIKVYQNNKELIYAKY